MEYDWLIKIFYSDKISILSNKKCSLGQVPQGSLSCKILKEFLQGLAR